MIDTCKVLTKHASIRKYAYSAGSAPGSVPKPSAETSSFDPHEDPMKEMLCYSPRVLDGIMKVQRS